MKQMIFDFFWCWGVCIAMMITTSIAQEPAFAVLGATITLLVTALFVSPKWWIAMSDEMVIIALAVVWVIATVAAGSQRALDIAQGIILFSAIASIIVFMIKAIRNGKSGS